MKEFVPKRSSNWTFMWLSYVIAIPFIIIIAVAGNDDPLSTDLKRLPPILLIFAAALIPFWILDKYVTTRGLLRLNPNIVIC